MVVTKDRPHGPGCSVPMFIVVECEDHSAIQAPKAFGTFIISTFNLLGPLFQTVEEVNDEEEFEEMMDQLLERDGGPTHVIADVLEATVDVDETHDSQVGNLLTRHNQSTMGKKSHAPLFTLFIYFTHLVPPTGLFELTFLPCHSSQFSFPAI